MSDPNHAAQMQRWQAPALAAENASADEEQFGASQLPTAEQLEEIQNQAWQEGFEQGRREGLRSAEQEIDERIKCLDRLLGHLAAPFREVDREVEEQLVRLALIVARHLVRREIKADPGQIVGVIREAMGMLPVAAGTLQIELHPEDAALVRDVLNLAEEGEHSWRIHEDPTLTRGGCRISNTTSRIDATVEGRLNQVIATVLGGERAADQDG